MLATLAKSVMIIELRRPGMSPKGFKRHCTGDGATLGFAGKTPEEAYRTSEPDDMMDEASALPTSPQARLQQESSNSKGV